MTRTETNLLGLDPVQVWLQPTGSGFSSGVGGVSDEEEEQLVSVQSVATFSSLLFLRF